MSQIKYIEPIKPNDVIDEKLKSIPPEVIESFNEIIVEKFNGTESTFKQDDVITKILNKLTNINKSDIFNKHWLDVEEIYRKIGWKVEYDKPGYNESYAANFTFKKK